MKGKVVKGKKVLSIKKEKAPPKITISSQGLSIRRPTKQSVPIIRKNASQQQKNFAIHRDTPDPDSQARSNISTYNGSKVHAIFTRSDNIPKVASALPTQKTIKFTSGRPPARDLSIQKK